MKKSIKYIIVAGLLFSAMACNKGETTQGLGNDVLNRSRISPHVVGETIELLYAMYMPKGTGKLVSASIEASIPGAAGTYMEHRAYSTDNSGRDVIKEVGSPSVTDGRVTTVEFTVDTCAVSLRYFYVVPEEARDKNVSFICSVTDSNGRTATFTEGPCKIRKMLIKKEISLRIDKCFFSLENLEGYTGEEAVQGSIPIDLVWTYQNLSNPGIPSTDKGSTFISPAALDNLPSYMIKPAYNLPAELRRNTDRIRQQNIIEKQLDEGGNFYDGIFIDDVDFESLNLPTGVEFITGIQSRRGFWMETADGKYRAYVYIYSSSGNSVWMNLKRYQMF